MAMLTRSLHAFTGMRQDRDDFIASPDTSPDACNMRTDDGRLSVATGFSRAVPRPVPTDVTQKQLYVYAHPSGPKYLACTDTQLYVYRESPAGWDVLASFGAQVGEQLFDFLPIKIGTQDYLLIAYGREQILKWDGTNAPTAFGSAAQLSDPSVNFIEQYFGRLYAAGDPLAPARLYWSQTPGGTRTIEDWSADDDSADVSGGFTDVGTDSDPITGLYALSNQLLIFKRDSLYRLLGDRPSNFRILPVDAVFSEPKHMACARYGDRLYFLSDAGLCFFDGQTVRRPASYRALHRLLQACDMSRCEAAVSGDTLYFAVRETAGPYNDLLIEYSPVRDAFMVRRGFRIAGLCAARGKLYALTDARHVVVFDGSADYDGTPIDAWWETPRIDLGSKLHQKALGELACTGAGDPVRIAVLCRGNRYDSVLTFPPHADTVAETVLRGEGRVFRLRFENRDGGAFSIDTGVTLRFESQARPE